LHGADITQRHIGYVRERGKEVYGVLMMSHMTTKEILTEEALKMESYGAEASSSWILQAPIFL